MGERIPKCYVHRLILLLLRYVKLAFPEETATDDDLMKLQEEFEQILIDYGLLKVGVEAVGDTLGRSAQEGAASTANTIRRARDE